MPARTSPNVQHSNVNSHSLQPHPSSYHYHPTTPQGPTPAQTIPSGPSIVLPPGDSITYGMGSNDGNSYRKELKDLLTKDGSPSTVSALRRTVTYRITIMKATRKPQVVTLMAGTNDMIGQDVSNAPTRFMRLLDKIFAASPDSTVFVASLIPLSFSHYHDYHRIL